MKSLFSLNLDWFQIICSGNVTVKVIQQSILLCAMDCVLYLLFYIEFALHWTGNEYIHHVVSHVLSLILLNPQTGQPVSLLQPNAITIDFVGLNLMIKGNLLKTSVQKVRR